MINLHVRKDFQKWLLPSADQSARIVGMCGAKTTGKYAGIPGVSEQQAFVTESGEFGWCVHCCNYALSVMNTVLDKDSGIVMSPWILSQYLSAVDVTANQIIQAHAQFSNVHDLTIE